MYPVSINLMLPPNPTAQDFANALAIAQGQAYSRSAPLEAHMISQLANLVQTAISYTQRVY
jgi:hypothetical protein